ncbi:DUF7511 domain-containing protein [Halosimplex amylolyticum]|uniref:DUF7511 domain-containing protein n=1 Tax=Halosimplex amylolyticum TaxID=3396616 RepID=UPI003F55FCE1
MSRRTRTDDDPFPESPTPPAGPDGPRRPDAPRLELALVTYADRPDRCTVYPSGATGVERMSTWVSVDRSLLVGRESMQ